MKKIFSKLLLGMCLTIGLAMVFTGCLSSYQGSANYNIPLSEQATLIIPFDLCVTQFNNERVYWKNGDGKIGGDLYVNIPEGTHKFIFNHLSVTEYSSGGYTYRTTSSASNIAAEGKFEAGNTYRAYLQHLSGNMVKVEINCIKERKAKNSFAGPESQWCMDIGTTSISPIGLHYGMKVGMVFDNITRMAWNIDTGVGVGFLPSSMDFSVDFSAVANYEIYFNRKGIGGVSIGGGLVWPIGPLYPFARIGIPFVLGGGKLGLYGIYYFTDCIIAKIDKPLFEDLKLRQFGFGASFSF